MKQQSNAAMEFLSTQMGKNVNKTMKDSVEISLNKAEIKEYVKRFNALDHDKKGFVSINDIRNSLEVSKFPKAYFQNILNIT
jgi:glycerol-3-phosphate dehydrogenase